MIVLFASLTSSIKAKKLLEKNGIKSQSIQTTKSPGMPDCGYALKLPKEHLSHVKSTCELADIKIKGIYYE